MTAVTYTGPLRPYPTVLDPSSGTMLELDESGTLDVTATLARTLVDTGEWTSPDVKPPTVEEIKTEVGDDPEKAAAALTVEQARPSPRSTLVEHLTGIISTQEATP